MIKGCKFFLVIVFASCFLACQPVEPELPEPHIALMDRSQLADDLPPSPLLSKIDSASARLIDKRNSRSYWAAYDTDGNICLIVGFAIGRPDYSAGMACERLSTFGQTGVTVTVKGANHFSSAVFVPDGYTQKLIETFPGNYVVTNLVAFDSLQALNRSAGDLSTVAVPSEKNDLPPLKVQIKR